MKKLLSAFLLTVVFERTFAQIVCKGSDRNPCRCDLIDGSGEIDISGLGRKDNTPYFNEIETSPYDAATYSYNPCYGFIEEMMHYNDLAVMQSYDDFKSQVNSPAYYDLGVQKKAVFKKNGSEISIAYESHHDSDPNRSRVILKCVSVENNTFTAYGARNGIDFEFSLTGPSACPKKASKKRVIIITVTSILTVAILVAMAAYYVRKGRKKDPSGEYQEVQ